MTTFFCQCCLRDKDLSLKVALKGGRPVCTACKAHIEASKMNRRNRTTKTHVSTRPLKESFIRYAGEL